ncbi:MAG: hypothetical protein FRX49_06619 [Trebouxia sp. A1-2]|nr:MAG: hypothetical protein FRX49_06619 [Trebouxia sp. A1-2]
MRRQRALGGHSPPASPDLVLTPLQHPLHALPLLEGGLVVHAGSYLVVQSLPHCKETILCDIMPHDSSFITTRLDHVVYKRYSDYTDGIIQSVSALSLPKASPRAPPGRLKLGTTCLPLDGGTSWMESTSNTNFGKRLSVGRPCRTGVKKLRLPSKAFSICAAEQLSPLLWAMERAV